VVVLRRTRSDEHGNLNWRRTLSPLQAQQPHSPIRLPPNVRGNTSSLKRCVFQQHWPTPEVRRQKFSRRERPVSGHSRLTTTPYALRPILGSGPGNGHGRLQPLNGGANVRCLKNRTSGLAKAGAAFVKNQLSLGQSRTLWGRALDDRELKVNPCERGPRERCNIGRLEIDCGVDRPALGSIVPLFSVGQ
jgi:hypothetical protein